MQLLQAAHEQQLALARDLRDAFEREQQARRQLDLTWRLTIQTLAAAIEARDNYTGGHIERVHRYSLAIADRMDVPQEDRQRLEIGAILHDVGKIGVPDSVLGKPGALTADEWQLMRQHPTIGAELLSKIPMLADALEVALNHHERWNGRGYPRGLEGPAIPLGARIVAVADSFDAMTTNRVYRRGRDVREAVDEIQRCSAVDFDPAVVEAFLSAWSAGAIQ